MKFRKKTVIVTAEQWFPELQIPSVISKIGDPSGLIETLEGYMYVAPEDLQP